MSNIMEGGILSHIERTYGWKNTFNVTNFQTKKSFKDKDFEKMSFVSTNGGKGDIKVVWDSCVAQGVKNDAKVTSCWNNVLGQQGVVDNFENFVKLILMQKLRVKMKRQTEANAIATTNTDLSLTKSKTGHKDYGDAIDLEFGKRGIFEKTNNFTNDMDLNRFSCFAKDKNNTYYIDEKRNCTALSFTKDGKVGIGDTDNKILAELNAKIQNDILCANDVLSTLTEEQLSELGKHPLEDLFVDHEEDVEVVDEVTGKTSVVKKVIKAKIPFYLLQTNELKESYLVRKRDDGDGETIDFTGVQMYLKKSSKGTPLFFKNQSNAYATYYLENFNNLKSYIKESAHPFPTFSNDPREIAMVHLVEVDKNEGLANNEFKKLKPLPSEVTNNEETLRTFWKEMLKKNCPYLHRFFFGENGDNPKCGDQSLFRIVYFDGIIFDANAHPSQVLCISDEGDTGKSWFAKKKREYWNHKIKDFICELDKKDVENPKSLYEKHPERCRIIEWQENEDIDLVNKGFFKQITSGADTISTEKKYGSVFTIPTTHFINTMYSNQKPRLFGYASIRRICPATMRVNYKKKFTPGEELEVAKEFDKYYMLCRYYYTYTKLKENDGTYICLCKGDYDKWLEDPSSLPDKKRYLRKAFTFDDEIKPWFRCSDLSATEEGEVFDDVVKTFFEITEDKEDGFVSTRDLRNYLKDYWDNGNGCHSGLLKEAFGIKQGTKSDLDIERKSKVFSSFTRYLIDEYGCYEKRDPSGESHARGLGRLKLKNPSKSVEVPYIS